MGVSVVHHASNRHMWMPDPQHLEWINDVITTANMM